VCRYGQEGGPRVLAVLEARGDVRVREVAGVLRLALEAVLRLRIELDMRAEDLQRDRAPEAQVDGAEDLARRTLAQTVLLGVELEMSEPHRQGSAHGGTIALVGLLSYRPLPDRPS